MTLKELYAKKKAAYVRFKELMDSIGDGTPTAEQQAQLDQCEQDMDDASEQIKQLEAQEARRERLSQAAAEIEAADRITNGQLPRETEQTVDNRSLADRMHAWAEQGMDRSQILAAMIGDDRDDRQRATSQAFSQWLLRGYVDPNLRSRAALQMDADTAGGYLVAPERFIARLIQDLDNNVFVRQFATVIPLMDAESLGAPSLDTDIADTNWTTELEIGTEDSSLAFGKRRLTPHPLAKYIKVSKDLLRSSAIGVEALVRERLAYKFGTVQETAFMTGSGAGQPLGLFTASDDGISTSRDVSTDNTTTAFTADGLIEAKYTLTTPYLQSGSLRWIMHRDAVKMARKLKDGDGQYILQPGLTADRVDTLLGVPISVSEYAPNTFTTGLYVGLIGDISKFWIADAMGMEIQRLVELGAATNQDYFIGRLKTDGMPVLENAFVRVTLA